MRMFFFFFNRGLLYWLSLSTDVPVRMQINITEVLKVLLSGASA